MASIYEILAHRDTAPHDVMSAPLRSSLGEEDYRPGHGQPGGNRIEREPSELDADPARFDYPTPTPRRPYRSGSEHP
jgi:hypothetical protein